MPVILRVIQTKSGSLDALNKAVKDNKSPNVDDGVSWGSSWADPSREGRLRERQGMVIDLSKLDPETKFLIVTTEFS